MANPTDLISRNQMVEYMFPTVDVSDMRELDVLISAASRFVEMYTARKLAAQLFVEVRNGNGQPAIRLKSWPIIQVSKVQFGIAVIQEAQESGPSGYYGAGWVNDESMLYLRPGIVGMGSRFPYGIQNVAISYSAGYTTHGQLACMGLGGWQASTQVTQWSQIWSDGVILTAMTTGTTGTTIPVWPTQQGATITDSGVVWRVDALFTGLVTGAEMLPDAIALATIQIAGLMYKQRDRIGDTGTGTASDSVQYFMDDIPATTKLLLQPYMEVTPVMT